jgi:predicted nuclease of predicted toxin-antitoxin system
MGVAFYMDHNVRASVTEGLRARGVDVITAAEDKTNEWDDARLLDRATALGRILFTQDEDFWAITAHRQATGIEFVGVIYAHQANVPIGVCVQQLELIAKVGMAEEFRN